MPKERIHAVHKKDIESILKNLGLFNDYMSGNLICHFCQEQILEENLFGFLVINRKIVPICNKTICSEKAIQHERRGN